jgi:hypothetical protein
MLAAYTPLAGRDLAPSLHMTTVTTAERPALDACRGCQQTCLDTVTHALRRGGPYADDALISALLDAADVCRTTIDFVQRGSRVHAHVGAVCAEICTRAAEACDDLAGDPIMAACAAACRRCATACARLSSERRAQPTAAR